jgi:hypothetical protein
MNYECDFTGTHCVEPLLERCHVIFRGTSWFPAKIIIELKKMWDLTRNVLFLYQIDILGCGELRLSWRVMHKCFKFILVHAGTLHTFLWPKLTCKKQYGGKGSCTPQLLLNLKLLR